MTVDVHTIKNTLITSNRVDTTALKKEFPHIAEQFTRESSYQRFQVA